MNHEEALAVYLDCTASDWRRAAAWWDTTWAVERGPITKVQDAVRWGLLTGYENPDGQHFRRRHFKHDGCRRPAPGSTWRHRETKADAWVSNTRHRRGKLMVFWCFERDPDVTHGMELEGFMREFEPVSP